jgi:hypothetical protein
VAERTNQLQVTDCHHVITEPDGETSSCIIDEPKQTAGASSTARPNPREAANRFKNSLSVTTIKHHPSPLASSFYRQLEISKVTAETCTSFQLAPCHQEHPKFQRRARPTSATRRNPNPRTNVSGPVCLANTVRSPRIVLPGIIGEFTYLLVHC